ncbi:MAG: ABC transporter permease [Elusimicrobia bacterium]|nr:ABC transporter permease [Elusimicrobiota bacterium]
MTRNSERRSRSRSSSSPASRDWALPAATLAAALLLWEAVARSGLYPPHLFPPPTAAARALKDMARTGQLGADLAASGRRWLLGLLIGNAAGVLLGAATGAARPLRSSVGTLINALRTIPFLILIPIAMLWLGLGEAEKVAITAWGAAFPVWLNTQTGFLGVERQYVWAAQCLGARGARLYWEVHLRRCIPYIVAGVRVSIATATFALAAAELTGAFEGLGFRIFYSYQMFQVERMMAGIMVVALLGLALDRAFMAAVARLLPWQPEAHE